MNKYLFAKLNAKNCKQHSVSPTKVIPDIYNRKCLIFNRNASVTLKVIDLEFPLLYGINVIIVEQSPEVRHDSRNFNYCLYTMFILDADR